MKDCEKGFTLIELVIVIGIIAVFSGVIFQVIATTSAMMRNTSATTKRQMEIQEIENKLEALLLKTNKKIYYAYGSADGILGEIKEGEIKDEDKSLYLVSQEEENSAKEETLDVITWDQKGKTLIYEQIKFCEYWGYERALASHIITNEFGIPSVTVDRQYTANASGQLRTRVQAFVESLEIKKIQKAKEGK